MDVRALLFGSAIRTVLTVVVGIGVLAGGAVVTGVVGVPGVAGMNNDFGQVNDSVTPVHTSLVVNNPNPIGIRLGGMTVNYSVNMNGVRMATGSKSGIDVGTGNTTINLTTYLENDRIPKWWVTHIENDEQTSLVVDADIHSGLLGRTVHYETGGQTISTDIISQFNSTETREVNSGYSSISDPLFYINRTSASWGKVTDAETPIGMDFLVYNPQAGPITMSSIGYNITMNNISVGNGELEKSVVIPSHRSKTVSARTLIDNDRLDDWWVSHLKHNQTTHLRIDFYAVVEPPVPGVDDVRVPLDGLTYTRTIQTHIFQDGNETADANTNSSGTDTTTTSGTTTTAGTTTTGETTATTTSGGTTATTTTSETTTSGENTTTDGGLLAISQGDTFKVDAATA